MDNRTYEQVISYIKSEILAGRLTQGEKLPPERSLAQVLNVSRTSVREALRTLEMLGLINSIQGAGNFIGGSFEKSISEALSLLFLLKKTNFAELKTVRETLEQKAAELAVPDITDSQIAGLEAIVENMKNAPDEETISALDKKLHDEIVYASGNTLLIQISAALSNLLEDFIRDIRKSILKNSKNKEALHEIHHALVRALKARDKDAVKKVLVRHNSIIEENI